MKSFEVLRTFAKIDGNKRHKVEYGFRYLEGNSDPYFTITYETTTVRGRWESCGSSRETICTIAPHLAPLTRWHLVGLESGPMHYRANARYWFSNIGVLPDAEKYFRSIVCATPDMPMPEADDLDAWLERHLPRIMLAFVIDVERLAPGLWDETVAKWEKSKG